MVAPWLDRLLLLVQTSQCRLKIMNLPMLLLIRSILIAKIMSRVRFWRDCSKVLILTGPIGGFVRSLLLILLWVMEEWLGFLNYVELACLQVVEAM